MKKIFSIILVCCASFTFAHDKPVFEETDEDAQIGSYLAFKAEAPPVFEEDDEEACTECESEDRDPLKDVQEKAFFNRTFKKPRFEENENDHDRFRGSYINWKRFKANFGMEKLFIRFPQAPIVSQSSTLLTASAFHNAVYYTLTGYYPPIGNINPIVWFDEVLYSLDHYPYNLVSHVTFQVSNGDWVMDYVAHDYVQNLVVKARAIVTPFNAYTIQCVKPNGLRDHFDYFIDNFWIKCECN